MKIVTMFFVFILGIISGFGLGSYLAREVMRDRAIEYGNALYCPKTGSFAFDFMECKKEPKP